MDHLAYSIHAAPPSELFFYWNLVDSLELRGHVSVDQSAPLKRLIFDRMLLLGLRPEDFVPAMCEAW